MNTKMKINSWSECSVSDYFRLREITSDDLMEPADKEVAVISVLSGLSEDEIWGLSITDFKELQSKTLWTSTPVMRPLDKIRFRNIEINGEKYAVETDITKFTVAQYIDFQTFWQKKHEEQYISSILACFIIPKGKDYADGYDINKLKDDIMYCLDIQTAYEIMSFFLLRWLGSTQASLDCLSAMTKKMMKGEDLDQQMERVEDLKKNISDGLKLLV